MIITMKVTETYQVELTGNTVGGGFEAVDVNTTPVQTEITDSEAKPSLSINDVSVDEDAGVAVFTVTLSQPSGGKMFH